MMGLATTDRTIGLITDLTICRGLLGVTGVAGEGDDFGITVPAATTGTAGDGTVVTDVVVVVTAAVDVVAGVATGGDSTLAFVGVGFGFGVGGGTAYLMGVSSEIRESEYTFFIAYRLLT